MADSMLHPDPTTASPPRDFVGYADDPPLVEWPGGARLAVSVVINYEEGAERNALDGDVDREPLVEAQYAVPLGERELFTESTFEYGSRVGIWRMLEVLDEHHVRPTIYAATLALERNPRVTQALLDRRCDFVGHGYRWLPHTGMSRDEESEHIRHCLESLQRLIARRAQGWFTRPPNTVNTRELLAEHGVVYDNAAVNDDLPYFQEVAGRPFLIVPYSLDVNDTKFFKNQFFTGRDFAAYAIDSFDALYAESARTPRMMSIGLHPRIIGRPGRIGGLRRVLEHIRTHDDVWVAGRDEIAQLWARRFAPPNTWNLPAR
jgi:peptidoglycan/xylan/chitin deacetylase (PgdA/CDA1 family)